MYSPMSVSYTHLDVYKRQVNSRVAHSQRSLKKGDVLTLELPQDKDYGVDVEKGPITVLYEDAHTLVVDKAPLDVYKRQL